MPAGVDDRAAALDGPIQDRRQVNGLPVQVDEPSRDAADIQQIIDQPDHVLDLPLDHFGGVADLFMDVSSLMTDQAQRVGNGGQRVAQLVGEHRQELILALIGLLERLFAQLAR